MALRRPLEVHFYHFWAPAAQMAFRKVLEVHRGSGSSLYRTCVAEDTFYRPCATQECAWDGFLASPDQFRTHLCSQYHFRVYPETGLGIGCHVSESVVFYDVFGKEILDTPVDCEFVRTGARQNGPEKLGSQGTHKLLLTWPEARLEENPVKHVPFQIAPDFRTRFWHPFRTCTRS